MQIVFNEKAPLIEKVLALMLVILCSPVFAWLFKLIAFVCLGYEFDPQESMGLAFGFMILWAIVWACIYT